MFTQKYITRKINQYKYKKAHMDECILPFTNDKYRKKSGNGCVRY